MKEKGILIKAKSSCYEEGSQENLWFCPERKGHKWGRKIRWHNWNPQMWRCREHRAIDQCVLCSEPCWPLGCQCTTTAPSGLGQLFAEAFCYLRVMLARAWRDASSQNNTAALAKASSERPLLGVCFVFEGWCRKKTQKFMWEGSKEQACQNCSSLGMVLLPGQPYPHTIRVAPRLLDLAGFIRLHHTRRLKCSCLGEAVVPLPCGCNILGQFDYNTLSERKSCGALPGFVSGKDPKAESKKWLDGDGCRSSYTVQGYRGILVQTIYRPI